MNPACLLKKVSPVKIFPVAALFFFLLTIPVRAQMPIALYMAAILAGGSTLPLTSGEWNETSVRKVLQTFAYGGHASDSQIRQWANMGPRRAIDEIMVMSPVNHKLSPPDFDGLDVHTNGYLEGLADFFTSNQQANHIKPDKRDSFLKTKWSGPGNTWHMAIRSRGLNTFFHRLAFFETNYHMSVNQHAGVYPYPLIRHYDNVMLAHSYDIPYNEVLAQGAKNAAIAYQYGHNYNTFIDGVFEGNDDFAREFHQLFFGILGEYEHDYHEAVSIENTAKLLTGMKAQWYRDRDVEITFRGDTHHNAPLEILHTPIYGWTAADKINQLAAVAINHPESTKNLPVMIIKTLADDNMTSQKKMRITQLWESLPEKNLLEFLKQYAISRMFHSSDRIKYHTSFDRNLFIANRMLLSNHELYEGMHRIDTVIARDGTRVFQPLHNVFGHQTGAEALNSPTIFKNAYNLSTERIWFYNNVSPNHTSYRKEWRTIIPARGDGTYRVRDVAGWLWQRFVADGWKNYGILERAHLYSFLASGKDLGFLLYQNNANENDPEKIQYAEDLAQGTPARRIIESAGNSHLALNSNDPDEREDANKYIQRAIAFIAATPYTFIEEGK